MRETFPVKLLMRLLQATPKQLMVIERILDGQALADWEKGGSGSLAAQSLEEGSLQGGSKAGSRWVFRRAGRHWEVVFGSNKAFYLNDMLAARCADYLLHHPNDPIAAFDLEVVVQAEKGAARARNSIQADSDARALRDYRQELRRLEAGKQRALAAGEQEQAASLEEDIQAIESELRGGGPADTGARAYDNHD